VTADSKEKVAHARGLVKNVIETAASTPEIHNELKQKQLRRVAELNGTQRDDEGQACQNCKYLHPDTHTS
jgi:splicing factor 1